MSSKSTTTKRTNETCSSESKSLLRGIVVGPRVYALVFMSLTYTVLAAIAALNFIVDPMGYFGTKLFKPAIQLTRNEKVAGIESLKINTSLILGSSRVLKLEPKFLESILKHNFYNAGVNFGKPEDFVALVQHYQSVHQSLPPEVIIGLDVVAFNDASEAELELTENPVLSKYLDAADKRSSSNSSVFNQLFGLQKTKLSLRCLRRSFSNEPSHDVQSFRSDGVIVYETRELQLEQNAFDFESALNFSKQEYVRYYSTFDCISLRRWELFANLVQELKNSGCKVYVFITPDHPDLVAYLASLPNYDARASELDAKLYELSKTTDMRYVNLRTIDRFDGDANAFVDGIHPLERNTRRLVRKVLDCESKEHNDVIQ